MRIRRSDAGLADDLAAAGVAQRELGKLVGAGSVKPESDGEKSQANRLESRLGLSIQKKKSPLVPARGSFAAHDARGGDSGEGLPRFKPRATPFSFFWSELFSSV